MENTLVVTKGGAWWRDNSGAWDEYTHTTRRVPWRRARQNPVQHSCLENPTDREASRATAQGVTESCPHRVGHDWSIVAHTNTRLLSLFSRSLVSGSLQPPGLQHTRFPCPSPSPGVYSNLFPLSQWCHPTFLSSVVPFSSCLQFFPASGSFLITQLFAPGGQSIGVWASASVLPMDIQAWFPLAWTGLISLESKGLSHIYKTDHQQGHAV